MKNFKKIILCILVLGLFSTTAVYAADIAVPTSSLVSALNGSFNKYSNRVQFGNNGKVFPTNTTIPSLCKSFDLPYSRIGGTKIIVSGKNATIYNLLSGATFSLVVGTSTAGLGTYANLAITAIAGAGSSKLPQLKNGTYCIEFYSVTAPQNFLFWKYTTTYTIESISSPTGVSVSNFRML